MHFKIAQQSRKCILTLILVGSNFTQKREKLQPWPSAAFSNILLETFVSNLVFLTRLSVQILGKTQTGVLPISGFLVNLS